MEHSPSTFLHHQSTSGVISKDSRKRNKFGYERVHELPPVDEFSSANAALAEIAHDWRQSRLHDLLQSDMTRSFERFSYKIEDRNTELRIVSENDQKIGNDDRNCTPMEENSDRRQVFSNVEEVGSD